MILGSTPEFDYTTHFTLPKRHRFFMFFFFWTNFVGLIIIVGQVNGKTHFQCYIHRGDDRSEG